MSHKNIFQTIKTQPPKSFNKLLVILIVGLILNSLVLNIRLARLQTFVTDLSIRNSNYLRTILERSLDALDIKNAPQLPRRNTFQEAL
ncbi:MAG: hypothetical protein COU08_04170 [Candidatus Harrisonbacteria bacterium CG10_big_fil_rev_8_21_14_0_10_42_17]|uniref:Histidine kinase n=1 Tax=Candidatus Harrisonbacteria bacterium CG10_big_fil_rev_8_21_14_0_10_42_17 TaxID=1974584 RepID=A0A2M6WGU5_9BACT|nr:MAG: hypothetical protein COU08_04170 [Candidatus Harrisonbacteria bacterium CG10_big_fil_rev_8_21_14_0_10_42_17]